MKFVTLEISLAIGLLIGIGVGTLIFAILHVSDAPEWSFESQLAIGILSLGLGAIAGAIWYRQP